MTEEPAQRLLRAAAGAFETIRRSDAIWLRRQAAVAGPTPPRPGSSADPRDLAEGPDGYADVSPQRSNRSRPETADPRDPSNSLRVQTDDPVEDSRQQAGDPRDRQARQTAKSAYHPSAETRRDSRRDAQDRQAHRRSQTPQRCHQPIGGPTPSGAPGSRRNASSAASRTLTDPTQQAPDPHRPTAHRDPRTTTAPRLTDTPERPQRRGSQVAHGYRSQQPSQAPRTDPQTPGNRGLRGSRAHRVTILQRERVRPVILEGRGPVVPRSQIEGVIRESGTTPPISAEPADIDRDRRFTALLERPPDDTETLAAETVDTAGERPSRCRSEPKPGDRFRECPETIPTDRNHQIQNSEGFRGIKNNTPRLRVRFGYLNHDRSNYA